MQNRKNRWQYIMVAVLMGVLALAMVGIPGVVQAANFGGLSDNGTAAYMGIGNNPHSKRPLWVFGNIALFERAVDSAGFIIQRSETNRWVFGANDNPTNNPTAGKGFVISTYPLADEQSNIPSKARLLVTQEGRVGINTTAIDPASKLNVYNDNQTYPDVAVLGDTAGGYTYAVGGTNGPHDNLNSLGFVGGSYSQEGAIGGIGAYGTNALAGTSGSLGTPNEGVYGYQGSGIWAAYFLGDVYDNGTLSAKVKLFRIDDPLDPTKYLQHASVESPDMMNIYNGSIVLDSKGEAVVQLPAYFEALNKDFQYQLTCIGSPALVYVKKEIADNSFTIAGDKPGVKVSWQVTGLRHDTWANANPLQVEVLKSKTTNAAPARQSAAGSGNQGWADWSKPPAMSK